MKSVAPIRYFSGITSTAPRARSLSSHLSSTVSHIHSASLRSLDSSVFHSFHPVDSGKAQHRMTRGRVRRTPLSHSSLYGLQVLGDDLPPRIEEPMQYIVADVPAT